MSWFASDWWMSDWFASSWWGGGSAARFYDVAITLHPVNKVTITITG